MNAYAEASSGAVVRVSTLGNAAIAGWFLLALASIAAGPVASGDASPVRAAARQDTCALNPDVRLKLTVTAHRAEGHADIVVLAHRPLSRS